MTTIPSLTLVRERKLCDLMPCDHASKRWEASGVLVKDRHYFVVFDDRSEIARVAEDLTPGDSNGIFGMRTPTMAMKVLPTMPRSSDSIYLSRLESTPRAATRPCSWSMTTNSTISSSGQSISF